MAKKKQVVDVEYKVKGADEVEESFDKAAESADKAAESTKKLNNNTSQLGSLFGGVVGQAGAMFTSLKKGLSVAINSFKTLRGAVISTGIGALAIAILGLVESFRRSEKGAEKFRVITASIGVVFDLLLDAVSVVGDAIVFAIEKPGEAWDAIVEKFDAGVNYLDRNVWAPMKAVFTLLVGSIEAGILKMRIGWNNLTGDAEEAEALTKELEEVQKEVIEAAKVIERAQKEMEEDFDSMVDSVSEFVDGIIEASDAAAQLQRDLNALENAERTFGVESAKANLEMEKLITLSKDKTKSDQERLDALKEAGKIEKERVEEELRLAEERFRIIKEQNALAESNEKALQEEADAEQKLYDIRTNFYRLQQRLISQESALTEALNAEKEKARQEEAARLKKEEEERIKAAETKLENEKALQQRLLDAMEDGIEKQKSIRQLAFDNEIADLMERGLLTAEVEKQLREELNRDLAAIDDDFKEQEQAKIDEDNKKKLDKEKELQALKGKIMADGFDLANSIFKEGSKEAEIIGKATALTQIGIDTAQAISSLVKNSEANPANAVTFGAAGIAQFAAGAIRIAKNLQQAYKVIKAPSPDIKGDTSSAPAPTTEQTQPDRDISFNGVSAGAERFGAPVKAYVTESEITQSQNNINNIQNLSELS